MRRVEKAKFNFLLLTIAFFVLWIHVTGANKRQKIINEPESKEKSDEKVKSALSGKPRSSTPLLSGSQSTIDIPGTRNCQFSRITNENCKIIFSAGDNWQQCYLPAVIRKLAPGIDLMKLTGGFVNPQKYTAMFIGIDKCKKETFIRIKSGESLDLACGFFKLRGGVQNTLRWRQNPLDFKAINLEGYGKASFGHNGDWQVEIKKAFQEDTVNITSSGSELHVTNFAKKFGIDINSIFTDKMSITRNQLHLQNLLLKNVELRGITYPGTSFEIYVKGKAQYPYILSKAIDTYIVAQYFKEEEEEETTIQQRRQQITPSFTFIFPYHYLGGFGQVIKETTTLDIPNMFRWLMVVNFMFSVSNRDVFLVFQDELNTLINPLRTKDDQIFAYEGANLRFQLQDFKTSCTDLARTGVNKIPDKVSHRVAITNNMLDLTTAEIINSTLRDLIACYWLRKPFSFHEVKEMSENEVTFAGIEYEINGQMHTVKVKGNQTGAFEIVKGIFSLRSSRFTLYSQRFGTKAFSHWKFNASGENNFLDEVANITTERSQDGKYTIRGKSEIFSMIDLRNRTRADFLDKEEQKFYGVLENITLTNLEYVVKIGDNQDVLRFLGQLVLTDCRQNHVEILYWVHNQKPALRLGIKCRDSRLDKVFKTLTGREAVHLTWLTFKGIALSFSKKELDLKLKPFKDAELADIGGKAGIRFATHGLLLDKVLRNDTYREFAVLLKRNFGDVMDLNIYGNHFEMDDLPGIAGIGSIQGAICGRSQMILRNPKVYMELHEKGGEFSLKCRCEIRPIRTNISDCFLELDGNGMIRLSYTLLKFESQQVLPLPFITLGSLKGHMQFPADHCPDHFVLKTFMKIKSIGARKVLYFGETESTQVINFGNRRYTHFRGSKGPVLLGDILRAMNINPGDMAIFSRAKCTTRLVVAYSGGLKDMWISEYNLTVSNGLHFLCTMAIFDEELFTSCKYGNDRGDNSMDCMFYFDKPLNISKGRLHIGMSKRNKNFGPVLVAKFRQSGVSARISGYIETVGYEKQSYLLITKSRKRGKLQFALKEDDTIYKEVSAQLLVTAEGTHPRSATFMVKLTLDARQITRRGRRGLISKVWKFRRHISKGVQKAHRIAQEAIRNQTKATAKQEIDERELQNLITEVQDLDQTVSDRNYQLTDDCLYRAKSVPMPGLVFDKKCQEQMGGSNGICFKWSLQKTQVLRVYDVVRCEAKKIQLNNQNVAARDKIKLLIYNIILKKSEIENDKEMIRLRQNIRKFAEDINTYVRSKTDVDNELSEVTGMWRRREHFFNVRDISVNKPLDSLNLPTIPYTISWDLANKFYRKEVDICHKCPFWDSFYEQIIHKSFDKLKIARDALDEADFRHAQIKKLSNDLVNITKRIEAQKRSRIPTKSEKILGDDLAYLLDYGDTHIPQFSVKNDLTSLAFEHLSPWSQLRKHNPFNDLKPGLIETRGVIDNSTDCTQVRSVIESYSGIFDDLQHMGNNYENGKEIVNETKSQMWEDFASTKKDIEAMEINATDVDKNVMTYWLGHTEDGLREWETESKNQLNFQNQKVFSIYRKELDQAYSGDEFHGIDEYLKYISSIGRQSYKRGVIENKDGEKGMQILNEISKVLTSMMAKEKVTLEYIVSQGDKVADSINFIREQIKSCS